jgi:hypothetical protein
MLWLLPLGVHPKWRKQNLAASRRPEKEEKRKRGGGPSHRHSASSAIGKHFKSPLAMATYVNSLKWLFQARRAPISWPLVETLGHAEVTANC